MIERNFGVFVRFVIDCETKLDSLCRDGQHSGVGHFGEPGALDRRGAVCADRRAKLVVAVLGGADCGRHDRRGGLQGGGRRSRLNTPHRPTANRRHRHSVAAICYF